MMKSTIGVIVVVFVVGTFCAELPKMDLVAFKKYQDECKAETGFDYEKDDGSKFPETRPGKCYVKCMSLKVGLITDKGEPQYEKIYQVFDIPAGLDPKPILKKCFEEHKDMADMCDKIAAMEKCAALEIMKFEKKP